MLQACCSYHGSITIPRVHSFASHWKRNEVTDKEVVCWDWSLDFSLWYFFQELVGDEDQTGEPRGERARHWQPLAAAGRAVFSTLPARRQAPRQQSHLHPAHYQGRLIATGNLRQPQAAQFSQLCLQDDMLLASSRIYIQHITKVGLYPLVTSGNLWPRSFLNSASQTTGSSPAAASTSSSLPRYGCAVFSTLPARRQAPRQQSHLHPAHYQGRPIATDNLWLSQTAQFSQLCQPDNRLLSSSRIYIQLITKVRL
jgi:hypothetical protein